LASASGTRWGRKYQELVNRDVFVLEYIPLLHVEASSKHNLAHPSPFSYSEMNEPHLEQILDKVNRGTATPSPNEISFPLIGHVGARVDTTFRELTVSQISDNASEIGNGSTDGKATSNLFSIAFSTS